MAKSIDTLNAILSKAAERGAASLSPAERVMYRVNRFLIDFDNGGLSGLLYNLGGDSAPAGAAWSELRAVADAIAVVGGTQCAETVRSVTALLDELPSPESSSWSDYLKPIQEELDEAESTLGESTEALWDMLEAAAERRDEGEEAP